MTALYRACPPPLDPRYLWTARFTFAAVRIQVLLLVALSLSAWFLGARPLIPLFLGWAGLAILPWRALQRGKPLWAGAVWSLICWVSSLSLVLLCGGQERDTFYTFLIVHIVAILVLGTRFTPSVIALAAISTSLVAGAQALQLLPQPWIPNLPLAFETALSISNVMLAGLVVWLMIDSVEEMVGTADRRGRDLADRNRTLEEIRQGLETSIQDRTRSLQDINLSLQREIEERRQTEQRLATTLEAAKAAAEAKSAFLANMSHEIRTPLNGVLGLADVLLSGRVPAAEQKFLVRALQSSGRSLQRILDDILDLSKLEADKVEVENRAFDLHELVEDVLDSFARDALNRKLELVAELDQAPKHIRSDPTRLRQILVNLVGNSLKFTQIGSITITITPDRESGLLRFSVRDTGIGIAAGQMDRLFEAFTQSDTSTTREFGGTGLGLAICQRLTALLGGRLWVESEIDRGSTFFFSARAELVEKTAAKQIHQGQGRAVILAPWSANRGIAAGLLEKWHYQVEVGEVYWEGLSSIAPLEILVVDLSYAESLPTQQLQELTRISRICLISASVAESRALAQCPKLGFDGVLAHPVTPDRLLGAIAEREPPSGPLTVPTGPSELLATTAPLSILLAEDNEINRLVALNILKVLGYEAAVARNGLEVLEALQRNPYDVVLMDLMMPRMDGIQATRRIRNDLPKASQPRIVAVTASVLAEQRQQCREAGMDDFLGKPLKLETTGEVLLASFRALHPTLEPPGIFSSLEPRLSVGGSRAD
ncbi:MAG: response regulator [Deltaproteobacteria bacterium]|nr:response regulator [Deltaproteobacteria bacterium]